MRWYQALIGLVFAVIGFIGLLATLGLPIFLVINPQLPQIPELGLLGGIGALIALIALTLVGLVYGSIMLFIGALGCYALGATWQSKKLRLIGKFFGFWLIGYWLILLLAYLVR